jgi:hypothetical protein
VNLAWSTGGVTLYLYTGANGPGWTTVKADATVYPSVLAAFAARAIATMPSQKTGDPTPQAVA